MLNHCKTSECNLQDMDLAFRKRYNALEEEVGQEEEEQNSFLRKICVERNIPPANADIMFKILASTDAETLPLRQTMVHFAAATTAHQKLSEERFEQEKAQLMQERDLLKKRVDEETRNVHNKRSHPMASPYNYNTVTTTTVKKETTIPQQAQPLHRPSSATAAAATNAAPNSFNYLGDVTVHGTMPLNNEKINNLIKVDQSNPYERRNNYQTNSQKLWSVSQQFHQICNTGSVVKLPTF